MYTVHLLTLYCILFYFNFCNSEEMKSFPHSLVLDSQPRFELIPSNFSNPYNFLINQPIFMKNVAKCSAFECLSYKVHVKVCNPIPLKLTAETIELI